MTSTFRLGSVAGVEIGIHWSWLLIFALIVWSLAEAVFPETNPGLDDRTYLIMAVVAVLLFFASLLLHELGHATRAAREGMEIAGITLWLFGGVARFRGMFPSAGAEFRIAIAGPLVSLAIGLFALATALLVPLPGAVDGVAFWLGYVNLVLLVFNMIPALPLDGGRVLRSLLWARRHDFLAATRTAAAIGQGFGQFLIALGALRGSLRRRDRWSVARLHRLVPACRGGGRANLGRDSPRAERDPSPRRDGRATDHGGPGYDPGRVHGAFLLHQSTRRLSRARSRRAGGSDHVSLGSGRAA